MKHASVLLVLLAVIAITPAYAAQFNTQSVPSITPPDSELLIFPDSTDNKPVAEKPTPETKPTSSVATIKTPKAKTSVATSSKPVTKTPSPLVAAPITAPAPEELPHASLSIAPQAPRPPRLVSPPGWN